jgi:hypothetical protein
LSLSTDTHVKSVSSTDRFFPTNHPLSAFYIVSGYIELSQSTTKKELEIIAGEHLLSLFNLVLKNSDLI